ncbi:oxidoreductase FAD-binding protein [Polychaeton citri CBS 116435]|uniref:Oxidoreductase FAD-binding protein n=1 Tax=Polychaeton citri CBS 116435 TaxID=1314669 RepID=A0A9P4UJL4_9PEZI|nr:oxidoreductase FAD-binding protein [Polychaeton citri CBS 116435]
MKLLCPSVTLALAALCSAEAWQPWSDNGALRDIFQSSSYHHWKPSPCDILSRFLPGVISYPDNAAYNASIASYWSVQEESVLPSCVVSPKNVQEVSTAVHILNLFGRYVPGVAKFAIRSGGHTPWAGAANIEDGVTIDLTHLNQVTLSDDKSTVTIGPGNRWHDVYGTLVPQGLVTGGGRVAIVGVGGLVLGGGVSFFSPRKGFVCDSVTRFQVVLASGEVVNATKDSHHDLWLALKGGSNNFGIVTEIEQEVFEQGDFWGGFVGYTEDTFDAQFEAFEALLGTPDYDPYASLIASFVFNATSNSWYAAHNIEYTKPEAYPKFFENFTSLPSTFSTMRISNLTDFTVELAASNPLGRRQLFATGTYKNSAAMMKEIFEVANSTVQEISYVKGLSYSLSFQPEPTIITAQSIAQGGNSLGLTIEDGPIFNVLLTVSWDDEEYDAAVDAKAKELFVKSETKAKQTGHYNQYIYLNYAAPWQDPIKGYGSEVVAKLQATSKKYDPYGTFQKQVPGGFKLF